MPKSKTVSVMSGLALEVAINRWLKPKFEADTGFRLDIDWRPTTAIMRSIDEGRRADVIIAIDSSMDRLVEAGIVRPATRRMPRRFRAGSGRAQGRPATRHLHCRCLQARDGRCARRRLLEGRSQRHLFRQADRAARGSRTRSTRAPSSSPWASPPRRSPAARPSLRVQQISELMSVAGIDVAGPFPAEIQTMSTFDAAIFTDAANPERCVRAARSFVVARRRQRLRGRWLGLAARRPLKPKAKKSIMAKKPRVVLLHGTPVAVEPIQRSFATRWPEAELVNLLDDFALGRQGQGPRSHSAHVRALHRARRLCAPPRRRRHPRHLLGVRPGHRAHDGGAADTGAQAQRCHVRAAMTKGSKIGMLATFAPSLLTMTQEFDEFVRESGSKATLETIVVDGAMDALRKGDAETHNKLVAARAPDWRLRRRDARPLLDVACRRRWSARRSRPGADGAGRRRRPHAGDDRVGSLWLGGRTTNHSRHASACRSASIRPRASEQADRWIPGIKPGMTTSR